MFIVINPASYKFSFPLKVDFLLFIPEKGRHVAILLHYCLPLRTSFRRASKVYQMIKQLLTDCAIGISQQRGKWNPKQFMTYGL